MDVGTALVVARMAQTPAEECGRGGAVRVARRPARDRGLNLRVLAYRRAAALIRDTAGWMRVRAGREGEAAAGHRRDDRGQDHRGRRRRGAHADGARGSMPRPPSSRSQSPGLETEEDGAADLARPRSDDAARVAPGGPPGIAATSGLGAKFEETVLKALEQDDERASGRGPAAARGRAAGGAGGGRDAAGIRRR